MAPSTLPDNRLDHLLVVAAKIFADKGYHPTTMRDLAHATGMSLAGMYHYVRGKDQLLYLIQERCFTAVLAGATAVLEGCPDLAAEERLRRFIDHHVRFFAGHMSEMKVLSHEAESLSEERNSGINRLKRRYVGMLADLIDAARPATAGQLDPAIAAYALFGMMNWIYTWYDPDGTVSPEALSEQFGRLFLHGLTEPSHTSVSHGG